jgi:DNA-binding ferritin-like protein
MEKTKAKSATKNTDKVGQFFGRVFAFNSSLKLYHWHISGKGSYAQHTALDQALEDVLDDIDRFVETSYAMLGDINIVIPETKTPSDIVKHCEGFYDYLQDSRDLLPEDFSQAIFDDYQETVQQLLYRLKRLQ